MVMIDFGRAGRVEQIQTHTSHVFLLDDEVLKIKKPVDFSFLDYRLDIPLWGRSALSIGKQKEPISMERIMSLAFEPMQERTAVSDALLPSRNFGVVLNGTLAGHVEVAYGTSGAPAPAPGNGTIALIEVFGEFNGTAAVTMSNVILADNQEPPMVHPFALGRLGLCGKPPEVAFEAVDLSANSRQLAVGWAGARGDRRAQHTHQQRRNHGSNE